MHQPALDRANGSLCPVTNAHLIQHAAHMDAHRFLGNAQLLSNIAVVLPARNTGKYFVLAGSQRHQRGPFCQAVARDRRKIPQALVHGTMASTSSSPLAFLFK